MSHFPDRFKGWLANLFWGVAGNAFYQMLAGGTLLALIAAIGSRFAHVPGVWIDRTQGALGACLFIVFGVFLISAVRFFQRGRGSQSGATGAVESALQQMLPPGIVIQHADVVNIIQHGPGEYDATVRLHTVSLHATAGAVASIEMQVGRGKPSPVRGFAALAIRHLYQTPSGNNWVGVWLLVSIKASDHPVSIVRWQASIKWATSEPVITCTFRNTYELDDDESLWWQGTHYAKNLAWGNLALVPHEQVDGYLHFAFENASERKLSGRVEEAGIEITDITGDVSTAKKIFEPLPVEE